MDNEILQILKEMQCSINLIGTKVDSLEIGQKELTNNISEINSKIDNIYTQTEFRTEVNTKLDKLKDLENVTKENCYEIAKLRAVN